MELQRNVYIIGPSSAGKTTLCKALADRLGLKSPQFVTEVAREVIKDLGLSRDDIGLLRMQEAIMVAQLARERLNGDGHAFLSDRSAVDPIVYAVFKAADSTDARARKQALTNLPEFQAALPQYRSSLFLLLKPVKEWLVDDGFRYVGDEEEVLMIFRDVLAELGIQYREIGEEMRDLSERTEFVLRVATAAH